MNDRLASIAKNLPALRRERDRQVTLLRTYEIVISDLRLQERDSNARLAEVLVDVHRRRVVLDADAVENLIASHFPDYFAMCAACGHCHNVVNLLCCEAACRCATPDLATRAT